ncbi:MAG: hypothetical protein R6W87_06570 [Halospina sp.]
MRLEQNRRAALREALRKEFDSNQVDLYALQANELAGIWVNMKKKKSQLTDAEIEDAFETLTGYSLTAVREHGSTVSSSVVLAQLAADMRRSGSIFTTYRVVQHEGRRFIVFNGKPELRKYLTGTRYTLKNPKIISMGVGKAAMKNLAKGSILFTLVASPATRTIEWLFANKQAELESVVAGISTDIVKAVISTGLAYFAGSLVATLSAGAVIAVAPLSVSIMTAVFVGYSLNILDQRFGITERLADGLAGRHVEWEQAIGKVRRDSTYFLETVPGQIEFMQRFLRR